MKMIPVRRWRTCTGMSRRDRLASGAGEQPYARAPAGLRGDRRLGEPPEGSGNCAGAHCRGGYETFCYGGSRTRLERYVERSDRQARLEMSSLLI